MRRILHCDMDCFYAAVEVRDDPRLRGRPVAVAWRGPRSVVTTASYEARRYGVRSAMPLRTALARCPHLVVIEPRMDAYREASRIVMEVFRTYTDLVEPLSLDEAFLDVTEPRFGPRSATLVARNVKREVFERTGGLTVSAGASSTKFVAKLASGMNKPDGLTVVRPEEVEALIARLPVGDFFGVGPKTARRMNELGIFTGADLRRAGEADLVTEFGEASGRHFWRIARGIDERAVDPSDDRKSVGAEETFDEDVSDFARLGVALRAVSARAAARLARHGLAGRTVTLKVKFFDFELVTRRTSLPLAVADADELFVVAGRLLTPTLLSDRPVRLLGVTVSQLEASDAPNKQPPLFGFVFP
ncbi:DNA polymerase IV [Deinococcus pimensis]|uniref:DNA polymerase IV n=1 Tax=Deinococcus pimensis TaxID=309888 RepID=UPI00248081C8|nr:DNA polymerase IV [Deinococcus pimensis]